MRLHRITLRNFRGVLEQTVTFDEGVTIIQGANEAGKSSLMEGLRLLRQYKSSSSHSAIRSVKPVDRDEGPRVEAELSVGPYRLVYAKQWLRSHHTTLEVSGPRAESLTGEAAHSRFLELLAEHADDQLLEALEVSQGGALTQAQLVNLPALRRALDETSLPVTENDALLEAVQQEYQRYFTATGRPTGDYLKAEQELEELRAGVEQAAALSAEIDDLTARHERVVAEHQEIQRRLREAETDLAVQREADQRVAEVRDRVTVAREHVASAQESLRRTERERSDRQEVVRAVLAAHEAVEVAGQEVEASRITRDGTAARVQEQQAELEEAEREAEDLRARIARAEDAERRRRAVTELSVLTSRLERLQRAEERMVEATRACEEKRLDVTALERLEEVEVACRVARGRLASTAASYRLEVTGNVVVDGDPAPMGEGEHTPISRRVTIEVPGQLRLEIAPDTDAADLDREFRAAREERAGLLTTLGVSSIEEARARATEFVRASGDKEAAVAEMRALLGEDSRAGLEARAETLRRHADLAAASDEDEAAALPGLREETEAVEVRLRAAETAHQEGQARLLGLRETVIRAEANLEALTRRARDEELRLEAARGRRSDEQLEAEVLAEGDRVAGLEARLEDAEQELAASDADGARIRVINAEALIERLAREETELEAERLRIETLLADRMASGPYDALNRATGELETLSTRQEARHRAAQAARRLRETLHRHRDEAQHRYVAPFKERIEALARPVFGPDLQVGVSPELQLVSRTLAGVTVPFAELSAGTREQLALIGRLACAELVDPEDGAPVLIDDALGFADPERVRSLAAVLNDVGSRAQVIILTCQPERFGHIGSARVVRI
ncbi:MAG: AAA family ATPase [Arachnia propionica]|uniref:ATP-binding protein n=1 Tax=Arachnia propionica TaxID=1750 RepID=UPI00270D2A91|nr:AAA family ATPase [Arachnia propionica]